MDETQTRRRYLLAVGTVGATGLAGCAGSESSVADTSTTAGTGSTGTDTSTTAENEAEATVREYLTALSNADEDTVASLRHPESPLSPTVEEKELRIDEVTTTTLSAVADGATEAVLDDARTEVEADVERIGAERYLAVRYAIEVGQTGQHTDHLVVVSDDDEWYVYRYVTAYLPDSASTAEPATEPTVEKRNRLTPVNTVGLVDGDSVGTVELTVERSSGSGAVDLRRTTLRWVDSTGTYDLAAESAADDGPTFSVTAARDEDGSVSSSHTLNTDGDRATLTVDLAALGGALGPEESATVRLTTGSGGTSEIRLFAPRKLSGRDAVSL